MGKALKSVSEVVAALGGTFQAAAILSVAPNTVSSWRHRGIPGNRQRDVERLMRKMGYTVKDSAFEGKP
jgi:hypothetical protein